jgi:hypothetical protein
VRTARKQPKREDFLGTEFSMQSIAILRPSDRPSGVSMNLDRERYKEVPPMKPGNPTSPQPLYAPEELIAPSSRLLDEKISDDSGTEAKIDSALAPAGLKNPFWK